MSKDAAPRQEQKTRGLVDLSASTFVFPEKSELDLSTDNKKEEMFAEWRRMLAEDPSIRAKGESLGFTTEEAQLEELWRRYSRKHILPAQRKLELIESLRPKIKTLLESAADQLGKYLPDWKAPAVAIHFLPESNADFRISDEAIYVGLPQLAHEKNPEASLVSGLAHEFFHAWMADREDDYPPEVQKGRSGNDKELTASEERNFYTWKTVDEGLAVYTSAGGALLHEHHEEQGRNYENFKKDSFGFFERMLRETNHDELLAMRKPGLNNMGHLYVVGYHIVESVAQSVGPEAFRSVVVAAKQRPTSLIDLYQKKNLTPRINNWPPAQ